MTELPCPFGEAYPSPIRDMFAGEIAPWGLSGAPDPPQAKRMLDRAFRGRGGLEGLVLHSDQGRQYRHAHYRRRLGEMGITQSMSRKGNRLDDSIMEAFFGTMKNEMFHGHEPEFRTFGDLERAVSEYIGYCNNGRIRGKTKWMPPSKFREASISGSP